MSITGPKLLSGLMPALGVYSLVVRYQQTTAVDHLSFEADAGQIIALLGPNGAGKTSTVETLEGYRRPDEGRVEVLGLDPVADRARVVPRIGVMLQRGGVYPGLTPERVVRLFASYYPDPADPADLLERTGLTGVARTPWRSLSGGEQQRVALALALVGRPEVAFLDEPTAGVDPAGRLAIRQLVSDLRRQGTTVVLTTHELEEAERLADRVLILRQGRLVAEGTPEELMRSGAGRRIRFGAPPGIDTIGLSAHLGGAVREDQPGEYVAELDASPAAVARLASWLAELDLPLADLRAGRQSLEDVFLELTSEASRAQAEREPRSSRRGRA
jgi:ABC-2 type transport system ATP-binding protein